MSAQTFQLVMQKGPTPGRIYELAQDEITIGRDITNHIVINDAEVSRRHARLTAQMGGYVIEDLGSTNGTFVDGQRLMGPHLLRPGQVVMLGEKITLAYEVLGFDPNATIASGASPATVPSGEGAASPRPPEVAPTVAVPETPPTPAYPPYPSAAAYPPPQMAYEGQYPAEPPAAYEAGMGEYGEEGAEEGAAPSRTWLFVGCGALLVIACCLVAGLFAFDYLNLYCEAPFNVLSGLLWSCPP